MSAPTGGDDLQRLSGGRVGDWARTISGRKFWPQDPRPGDVEIEDIAHALSLQCRFAGHTPQLYSVAQHSVLVSKACRREHALIGLLHDATEAYLQDIIRPLKRFLAQVYKPLEIAWALAIGERFGLGDALVDLPDDVERADRLVLVAERRDLLPPYPWPKEPGYPEAIDPWAPHLAKACFLVHFQSLGGGSR